MNKLARISALALLTLTAFSCGGDKKQQEAPVIYEENTSNPESEDEAPLTNSLIIESNDKMQYTKNELRATVGTIVLTLKNTGKMDKAVMGHNLVILKPGTDIADFAAKANNAKATDYIPASENTKIIAHTNLLGAGESDTIEFTITEKGNYDYICSFPGHYALMKGKLIVE